MSTHGTHWLEREDIGALSVVRLKVPQALDEEVIRDVFDLIFKLLTEVGRNQLVLNLATAESFPSLGLGKLVMLNRKAQALAGRLALCHLAPNVRDSLERTRLMDLFNVYGTEAEAVQSFAATDKHE